jgi:heme exporter protein C
MRFWLLSYDSATRWLLWAPLLLLALVGSLILHHLRDAQSRSWTWKTIALIGVGMMLVQPYLALSWVPPERYMGDTGRIFYMHVPQVWMALLALTLNFGASISYLFKKSFVTDSLAEATAEVGVFFGTIGVVLGAIWAKPTWGTWWTWDPRLTTAAILLVIYAGYLALRRFVEDPEKRATWSAVMGIVAFVDIPVLWFSVKWWRSMHQAQSNPSTVDPLMVMVLRWSSTGFLALLTVFIYQRFLVAQATRHREVALPDALPEI